MKELIYEAKYQISARPEGPQTSYHPLDLCPQSKVRLGVSKKVLKVLAAQRASKLQHLKVFGGIFLYIKVEQKLRGAATLRSNELQELLAPFWIPPVSL